MTNFWRVIRLAGLLLGFGSAAQAHPLIENALDVVIERDRVVVDARISPEEILVVGTDFKARPPAAEWTHLQERHGDYLRQHFHLTADGVELTAQVVCFPDPSGDSRTAELVGYRLEYPTSKMPRAIRIEQNLLSEFSVWSVSCVVRIRQSTQPAFQTALLEAGQPFDFACDRLPPGDGASSESRGAPVETEVRLWPTIQAYTTHGVMHILTGYDHLLFVSALVLAATSIWDLVKVVSAFTLAHTLTLTLAMLGIVSARERVVEPIIAASIVLVAAQNLFWPDRSRGWTRIAVAFGFGLFHGLGFAGGLKDAMSQLPSVALWTALASFSIGVELGHQIVVIPLYMALRSFKRQYCPTAASLLTTRAGQIGSAGICLAGVYFLVVAVGFI